MGRTFHDGDLGTMLAVFAHPDDEAYLAGGLMALAVDAGRRVVCVTATRGERGFPDDDPRSLAERAAVRTTEMQACLAELGVTEHVWLEYPDGACVEVEDEEAVGRVAALIEEVRPDTVVTFGPDGQTYHEDHIAVSRWTTWAVRRSPVPTRLLYAETTPEWVAEVSRFVPLEELMMTDDPPPTTPADELSVWFVCDDKLAARKVRALRAQASQVEGLVAMTGVEAYIRLTRDEMFRDPTDADWST